MPDEEWLWSELLSFVETHALWIVSALLLLLAAQSIRLLWIRTAAARRVSTARQLGAQGERRARLILKRAGFHVREEQCSGSYALDVDGEPQVIHLRADFIVEKKGKFYVAEVKAGVESAKITGRATRRQLLEYSFAFEVEGVLLVDVVERRVRRVRFPAQESQLRAG